VSVSTVLWDAAGVLQRVPHGWEESMRPALEGRVDDLDGFLAEAVRAERPALTGDVRWRDVLPGLLGRWGIADAYDHVVEVWLSIEEVPGTRDLVRGLRASGVRCCLATNQDEHRASYMRERLGYADLLDETFFSCDLGVAKPDPAYFSTILDRLDVPAGEVLFVDDNAANVAAARSVGLAAEEWSYREDLAALRGHLARHGLPV
jgi:putative hydrolase of the HAD superfamily